MVCAVGLLRANACATFSIMAFDMPMALTGYTALSVPRHTTLSTPFLFAASITFELPMTLVRTASIGKNSHEGTCLRAVSYTHLRAHETDSYLVCRLLLEKKKKKK